MKVTAIIEDKTIEEAMKYSQASTITDACQQLIEKSEVKTIEIIFAELIQDALNKREIEIIKTYYELIPKIEIDHLYIVAGEYSRNEKLIHKNV